VILGQVQESDNAVRNEAQKRVLGRDIVKTDHGAWLGSGHGIG
jgi:hypothetical protein